MCGVVLSPGSWITDIMAYHGCTRLIEVLAAIVSLLAFRVSFAEGALSVVVFQGMQNTNAPVSSMDP